MKLKDIRLYNEDKTLNKEVIYLLINAVLDNIDYVRSDRDLANALKNTINNKLGLTIYKVFCKGNSKEYNVTIAAKSVTFTGNEAKSIVAKLMRNRQKPICYRLG